MKTSPLWELYGAVACALVLIVVNTIVVDRRLSYARMSGLQRLVDTVLFVLMTVLLVHYYSWGWGMCVAIAVGVARLMIGRIAFIRRRTQHIYRRVESRIMHATRGWYWLEWVGLSERDEAPAITSQSELRDIVARSRLLTPREQRTFETIFERPKKIHSVMVPAERIVTVAIDETLGPLVLDDLHRSGYRQFPVIDGDIDHIVGVLYLDDIVDLRSAKSSVRDAADLRIDYAAPDELVDAVMRRCLDNRRSVVIVHDDDRSTLGMVLLRNLIQ